MSTTGISHGIEIEINTQYIPEESDPQHSYYFFTYTITITNREHAQVQLISRHWIITDGLGRSEEVVGDGVVGKQPILKRGESFTYTSACPLPTKSGTMGGTYSFIDDKGNAFKSTIPQFDLIFMRLLH